MPAAMVQRTDRVALFGEYDLSRQDELREALAPLQAPCTIDLSQVTFCDSLFLQELVNLKRRLPDGAVSLVGANPQIQRLLNIVSFGTLFNIEG